MSKKLSKAEKAINKIDGILKRKNALRDISAELWGELLKIVNEVKDG